MEHQKPLFPDNRMALMSAEDRRERVLGALEGFEARQRVRNAVRARKLEQRRERIAIRADEAQNGPLQKRLKLSVSKPPAAATQSALAVWGARGKAS